MKLYFCGECGELLHPKDTLTIGCDSCGADLTEEKSKIVGEFSQEQARRLNCAVYQVGCLE